MIVRVYLWFKNFSPSVFRQAALMSYLLTAFGFLINVISGLFVLLLSLRFLLQLVRTPYSDSLGIQQFVFLLTQPLIKPLNRVIPRWRGLELSTPLLTWGISFVSILLINLLVTEASNIATLLLFALGDVIETIIYIYIFSLFIFVLMSFINPNHPLYQFLRVLSSPILNPLQRRVQPINGIDLSVLIALILLQLALILIVAPLKGGF